VNEKMRIRDVRGLELDRKEGLGFENVN